MTHGKITKIIFQVLDDINLQMPEDQQIEKSLDTILFGPSGKLDSLGLVNLVVGVEEKIEEEFGGIINLANEANPSPSNSPFRTIRTLLEYTALLLEDKASENSRV